ncbi:MAG: FAD-dependent oxidoreductase [Myxococcota bacterium]
MAHAEQRSRSEKIFGEARQVVERFFSNEACSNAASDGSLEERVRKHVYDRASREQYVAMAMRYLEDKHPSVHEEYDVVVVGAGIHAAVFIYTVKQNNPCLKALIVERSKTVCSTFFRLGDSLVLNSPTFSKVGLNSNVVQNHFVQLSDFDELTDLPFPTAKHLYQLTTMMLFHADADILFDFEAHKIKKAINKYFVANVKRTVEAKSVVIANGMGEQRTDSFVHDKDSADILNGDDFISAYSEDETFIERIRNKTIAVIGAGDTANCVMEHLLPLSYPNSHYSSFKRRCFVPSLVYWIGQSASSIQEFYFANKKRYCHSGGIIEYFWHGEQPFDLPTDSWIKTKALIQCMPDKLTSVSHKTGSFELKVGDQRLSADIVVDCTGRFNALSAMLLRSDYEFVEGNIVFRGGGWDENLEGFSASARFLEDRKIACKLQGERIYLIGCAAPMHEIVSDEEARDGTLRYQEDQQSLTNSKIALEHTLPRSFAFALQFLNLLETGIPDSQP